MRRPGKVLSAISGRSRALTRGVAAIVVSEREELTALVGLALLDGGLWMVWRPAAFIVSGVVLLWMTLPSRRPFVVRPDPLETETRPAVRK